MLVRLPSAAGLEFLVDTGAFKWARPAMSHEMAKEVVTMVCFDGEKFGTTLTLDQIEAIIKEARA